MAEAYSKHATVPIRCQACGQQTHKTLDSLIHNKGFLCACGAVSEIDLDAVMHEFRKSTARIRDFGNGR